MQVRPRSGSFIRTIWNVNLSLKGQALKNALVL